ncbi:hypothetical protein SAMN04487904_101346 [Actinopolyspora lacussalsi subsp. righensis]|uniref:Uncharacterized protein n=1 Tax=Actinopolyspora righensis TaxID=995060 RepID=A0A1I6X8R0_9ACTN|nr:hypothetical protein [Actinopolyspora righensis]SFT34670.1 hypothetical protein SAMN04487904_101346 [Actinopolyspora righensis]
MKQLSAIAVFQWFPRGADSVLWARTTIPDSLTRPRNQAAVRDGSPPPTRWPNTLKLPVPHDDDANAENYIRAFDKIRTHRHESKEGILA